MIWSMVVGSEALERSGGASAFADDAGVSATRRSSGAGGIASRSSGSTMSGGGSLAVDSVGSTTGGGAGAGIGGCSAAARRSGGSNNCRISSSPSRRAELADGGATASGGSAEAPGAAGRGGLGASAGTLARGGSGSGFGVGGGAAGGLSGVGCPGGGVGSSGFIERAPIWRRRMSRRDTLVRWCDPPRGKRSDRRAAPRRPGRDSGRGRRPSGHPQSDRDGRQRGASDDDVPGRAAA